MENKEKETEH